MPREYDILTFLRAVIALALVWAVVGSFLFSRIMHYFGWDSMNVEWQMMLFGILSLDAAVLLAIASLGVMQMFKGPDHERDRERQF